MTRSHKLSLVLVVLSVTGFAGSARSASFDLGHVSGPATLPVGNSGLSGPFQDDYHFTIDPGASLIFGAPVSTGFATHFGILDMDMELDNSPGTVVEGDAFTVFIPGGIPSREVTFPPRLLGPGDYVLSVFGTATGAFPGLTASYHGNIQLAATPLPGAFLLMLTALAGLGAAGRCRTPTA